MATVNRKHMILESLVNLLQEDDLPNITTKVLAVKSDITEPAIYKHYKGKNEIFQALFKFIEQTIIDKIYEVRNKPVNNLEKAKTLYYFLVLFVESNPGFARFLNRECLSIDEKEISDKINLLFMNIENEFGSYGFTKDHCKIMITTIEGIYTRFSRSKFKELPSSYLDYYYDVLVNNLS